MKKLVIEIEMDNDAFVDDPSSEVCDILENLIVHIAETGFLQDFHILHDTNGNDVGSAEVVNE